MAISIKTLCLPFASAETRSEIVTNSTDAKTSMAILLPSEFTPIPDRALLLSLVLVFLTCRFGMRTQLRGLL